ncbi:hypothetical protein [Brevundimonas pishanensis]|uniref:hypothetical protein n=1 Tax=Brevundimonas pishanensis TaxID=2896315 RepID=UPI001FA79343|nr:hypothetical protein [Brevundimonas pishanensis]
MFKTFLITSVATLAVAGSVQAQTAPGRWSVSLEAGAEFPVDGDVHGGATARVPDLGPLNPALAGVDAELRIQPRSFDDIYGEGMSIGAQFAYEMMENGEAFGTVRYMKADEGRVQVGGAFVPALNATLPVYGIFSDYESWAIEAGYRQYFGNGPLKPYVAGRLGAVFTDKISATFEIPDGGITIADAPFYDSSTSFTAGLDVGVSYAVSDMVTLQAETGIRHITKLEDDDSAIGGLGLASINNVGERTYMPLTVRARFAF